MQQKNLGNSSIKYNNCFDTVEIATNFLGIPLPPHRTPTHGTASPEWLYPYFLNSPYYAPYAHRESKLLNALKLYKESVQIGLFEEPSHLIYPSMRPSAFLEESEKIFDLFPSQINQPRYGGIALNKKAELKIRSSEITGAIFDPLTGQVILIGQKKIKLPEMPVDALAVAFKSVYGLGGFPPADPAVSIEPDHEKMKVVYSGQTYGTQFGRHLFEADRTLKGLVLGSLNSHVPGYASMPRKFEIHHIDEPSTFRTWIVPETIELIESDKGHAMVFSQVKMKCMAETSSNTVHPYHEQFASHFTTYYDSFALEYPIFQEIKRLAQITGVVKWLKENNIPIDHSYFNSYSCIPCETPLVVDRIELPYRWMSKKRGWRLGTLSGGIDLHFAFSKKIVENAGQIGKEILASKPDECSLNWDLSDGKIADTCTVLKTKKAGNFHLDFIDIYYPLFEEAALCFSRSYDSFNELDFGMGIGWSFTPAYLEIPKEKVLEVKTNREAPQTVLLKMREKDQLLSLQKYQPNGTLIYASEDNKAGILLYPDEIWHYISNERDDSLFFNKDGLLTHIQDKKGVFTTYHYEEGRLSRIACFGRSIEFSYQKGRLIQAKGPETISIIYQYNPLGELIKAGEEMAYSYDENHRLCRFCNPENFLIFQGTYDDFNRIKTEKWGPIESINEYSIEEQTIQRNLKIDDDELSKILQE